MIFGLYVRDAAPGYRELQDLDAVERSGHFVSLSFSIQSTAVYTAIGGNDQKVFEAEEWLAAMCSHLQNQGEQMVRYYGWYNSRPHAKAHDPPVWQYAAADIGQPTPVNIIYGDPHYPWDASITS